jgi:putative oxidoreductase
MHERPKTPHAAAAAGSLFMIALLNRLQDLLEATRRVDFLAPLALRLYLVPVFWVAGMNKAGAFGDTVSWFGNADWGLGLPLPWLMVSLVIFAEAFGAILLLLGLAVRWIAIPLLVTMVVAATMVHWENGWQAVHDPMSPFASQYTFGIEAEAAAEARQRQQAARSLLREHGNWNWLTEKGSFIIAKNGIEWAATYFVMVLALFFTGAGRLSLDHAIARRYRSRRAAPGSAGAAAPHAAPV